MIAGFKGDFIPVKAAVDGRPVSFEIGYLPGEDISQFKNDIEYEACHEAGHIPSGHEVEIIEIDGLPAGEWAAREGSE